MNEICESRWRYLAYFAVLVLLLANWNGSFPLDDAYIALHNARSLLAGEDLLYDSSPLTGSTSSVHLLLLAVLGLLLPLPIASLFVASAGAALYALGLDALVRKMGARGWHVPVLVLVGLLGGIVPLQLFNGLETGLAAAVAAWLLVAADDRRLPILAGIAPFVRPDLALLAMLLLVRRWLGRAPAVVLREGTIAGLIALPFLAWLLLSTGHPMPQTAYAKALFFAQGDWPVSRRFEALATGMLMSGFLAISLGIFVWQKGGWVRATFVAGVMIVCATTIPNALGWNHCRYLMPLVPVFLAGIAVASTGRFGDFVVIAVSAASLASLPSVVATLDADQAYWKSETDLIARTTSRLPRGSVVLIHDAGMIAWLHPDLHLIDAAGLKTPDSTEWHRRFTRHECQLGDALDGIVRTNKVQYALILNEFPWSCIRASLAGKGWRLTNLNGPSHYQLFALSPPPAQ